MTTGALTIRTLEARIHHAGNTAAGLAARQVAETVLSGPLPRDLGQAVTRLRGEGVAVINRLEIAVSLIPDETADLTAIRWAQAIFSGLRRALMAPDQIYADRTEHLACYIEAVLSARRSEPAFHAFAGFAAMPQGMAIRAALCAPEAPALATLQRLSARSLRIVLTALSEADALLILQAIGSAEPDARIGIALTASALEEAAVSSNAGAAALSLVVTGTRPNVAPGTPRVTGKMAVQFATVYLRARHHPQSSDGSLDQTPSVQPAASATLHQGMPKVLRDALNAALPTRAKAPHPRWMSPVAGFAMLMPALIAMIAPAGMLGRAPAAARLRFDLLVAATRARASDADPVLRILSGLRAQGALPACDPALVRTLAKTTVKAEADTDALADMLIARFTTGIRGFETASTDYVIDNFLATPGHLTIKPNRLILRYQPPPVLIALQMAGCDRSTSALPWCRDQPLDIAPEGAP